MFKRLYIWAAKNKLDHLNKAFQVEWRFQNGCYSVHGNELMREWHNLALRTIEILEAWGKK